MDVKLTKSVNIDLKNGGHKLWLLNSLSVVILKKLQHDSLQQSLNEGRIESHLINFGLPKLEELIFKIKAYLRMEIPSYMIHYASMPCLHNNIGSMGLKSLVDGCASHRATNEKSSTTFIKRLRYQQISNPMKQFVKSWRQCVNQKFSHAALLEALKNYRELDQYSLAEQILVDWIYFELESHTIDVSTLATYFSNIHPYILNNFASFTSLDDISDQMLLEDIYPKVLNDINQLSNIINFNYFYFILSF
jgi:hypothetical protein